MKFTANSIELQHTLSKLMGVIPAKSTMPILEYILFDLTRDELTLTATDLALSLTVSMQVRGAEDGKIAIPAKRLVDTIKSLPDTDAVLTADQASNRIKVTTENGEYNLTGESAKEFPAVPPFKGTDEITLDSASLKKIIHRTTFAVSSDELRPAMMGVLFQAKEKDLRAVSTDGHRLVKMVHKMDAPVPLKRDIVIPAKALLVVGRSMEDGPTTISVGDTHVRFGFANSFLVSRLIDESYPNYESVIPLDNTNVMTVGRDAMMASIRRVALYASATTHQVRFDVGKEKVQIAAQDLDFGGEARETISCTYTDESLEIGFNSTYLIDILSHLESEKVAFKFSAPTRAGIVMPAESNDRDEVLMLVMPVRLNV